jgi:hypothetical protein
MQFLFLPSSLSLSLQASKGYAEGFFKIACPKFEVPVAPYLFIHSQQ